MRTDSLAFRFAVITGIWALLALAVGGPALSVLFQRSLVKIFDARLEDEIDNMTAALFRAEHIGSVENLPFTRVRSEFYWQVMLPGENGPEILLKSNSLLGPRFSLPIEEVPDEGERIYANDVLLDAQNEEERPVRVLYASVRLPGNAEPYIIAVGVERGKVLAEAGNVQRAMWAALGLMAAGFVIAVLLILRLGLSPLRRVRGELSAIRSGRARRIDADSLPYEIKPMAEELNSLLDHNEDLIQRARIQVGNLAHALKTPLTVLSNEAASRSQGLPDIVLRQTETMRGQVQRYLARARTAASGLVLGARTEARQVIEAIGRTLWRIHRDDGKELEVDVAEGLAFRGERHDFEEMVGNLMDNAFKWARGKVRLTARPEDAEMIIAIEDDGPGLPEDQCDRVLKRGARLDESVPGSGLGLSIVYDLAKAYRGNLKLGRSEMGGLRAELTLPRAPSLTEAG
ncbi:MAG: sensor histidine kinase [Alphaproteobacteria bacterium]